MWCSVHGVYESICGAIHFRYRPTNPGFNCGMNEIRDGLLAVQCGLHQSIASNHIRCRVGCGKPAYIYKKQKFRNNNSME